MEERIQKERIPKERIPKDRIQEKKEEIIDLKKQLDELKK